MSISAIANTQPFSPSDTKTRNSSYSIIPAYQAASLLSTSHLWIQRTIDRYVRACRAPGPTRHIVIGFMHSIDIIISHHTSEVPPVCARPKLHFRSLMQLAESKAYLSPHHVVISILWGTLHICTLDMACAYSPVYLTDEVD